MKLDQAKVALENIKRDSYILILLRSYDDLYASEIEALEKAPGNVRNFIKSKIEKGDKNIREVLDIVDSPKTKIMWPLLGNYLEDARAINKGY